MEYGEIWKKKLPSVMKYFRHFVSKFVKMKDCATIITYLNTSHDN